MRVPCLPLRIVEVVVRVVPALLLILLCVGTPASLFAWGPTGHRCTALVAERHLKPATKKKVRALLDGQSLAKASTWADEIRSDPSWNYSAPWHYINIEDSETYATAPKSPGGDVVQAIQLLSKTVQDTKQPKAKRAEALRFLIHFVGDIHQPLHVGRRSDLGGNKVQVQWFGEPTNLHSVWDSAIIRHWDLSYTELTDFLEAPKEAELRQWQRDDVLTWAKESMAYRKSIYDVGNGKLSYAYADRHSAFIQKRLLQGGIRLAALLNRLLAD